MVPIPTLWVVTECQAGRPVLHSSFSLAVYFTHGSVDMSVLLLQFIPPSPSTAVFTSPFSRSASPCLPCRFSRQEYWNGLPFAPLRDIPYPGIKPGSPALQVVSLLSEPPWKPPSCKGCINNIWYLFFSFWLASLYITGSRVRSERKPNRVHRQKNLNKIQEMRKTKWESIRVSRKDLSSL